MNPTQKLIFPALALALASSAALATPTLTTLASFNGANGSIPYSGLIADAAGNLYGTTYSGGSFNLGTIFKLPAAGGPITTITHFNGANGQNPWSALLPDNAGNVYGTTEFGGANNAGTVFKLPVAGGPLTTLASFNVDNGAHPQSPLVADNAGNLYGTTSDGGPGGKGTVFKVSNAGGPVTTIAAFKGFAGTNPSPGLLIDSAGNLYGTTELSGVPPLLPRAIVYKLPATGGPLVQLGNAGAFPGTSALIADHSGNLYGTTLNGIFSVPQSGGAVITVAYLGRQNDPIVFGSPIFDAAGNLFGTFLSGSVLTPLYYGGIYTVPADGGPFTVLATFNLANGANPEANLIPDAAGNLYGTTSNGGDYNLGTVFKLSNSGFVVPEPQLPLALALPTLILTRRRRA